MQKSIGSGGKNQSDNNEYDGMRSSDKEKIEVIVSSENT